MKTVLANYLHRKLRMPLVESAYLGCVLDTAGMTDNHQRTIRRNRLKKIVESHLDENIPVIVDAAFHREKDRHEFVTLFKDKYPHFDIIIVWCMSSNKKVRAIRRIDRNEHRMELETHRLSQNESERLLDEFENPQIELYSTIPIVKFDSDKFEVTILGEKVETELLQQVNKIIDFIVYGIYTGKL